MTGQPELEEETSTPKRPTFFDPNTPDASGHVLTIKQASEQYAVSERTLRRRLDEGKIPGAYLSPGPKGEQWQIPAAALMILGYRRLEPEAERSAAAPAEAETVKGLLALIEDLRSERKELTAGRNALAERAQALEVELAATKERLIAAQFAVDMERERREQAQAAAQSAVDAERERRERAEALAASTKKRWWQRSTNS